jgi:hypothetical protein
MITIRNDHMDRTQLGMVISIVGMWWLYSLENLVER